MNYLGDVLTAMVTPFTEELTVDYDMVRKLARHLVNNGSDGLVVLGTTGEVPTLSFEEKAKILKTVVDEIGDSSTIVAGSGSYSTSESIKLTKKAEEIGVDGIMLVTPYYNKPPQDGLYKHFKLIATETSLPVILYNVPGRTSRNIEVDTVQRLAMIDNIVAIKEASGDLEQVSTLCRTLPDDFYIYSGDDGLTLPTLSVGGQGIISVAAHLVGNEIKEMVTAFKAGKIEKAIKLNKYLGAIFSGIFINTNPIPVKAALNMIGMNVGGVRPPLVNLTVNENNKLKQILQDLDLI